MDDDTNSTVMTVLMMMTVIPFSLDEENMDWSPQTNYHRAHCKAPKTHNLASV